MRDSEAERSDQAKSFESMVTSSLGQRLKDASKLHEVIEAMTAARDESVAVAFAVDEPTGVLVRASVRDDSAADRAVRGALDLTKAEPFKDLLRVKDVTSTSEELPGLGKISVATLVREPKEKDPKRGADAGAPRRLANADGGAPASKASSSSGVAWVMEQGMLSLGAGAEPLVTLKIGAKPDRKLADEPSLERFTTAVGADATTLIVAQPLRFDPKRANLPPAPLGIAVGRKGGDAFVRIDIPDALLREAARWQMGF
jgi:hypothetical protein